MNRRLDAQISFILELDKAKQVFRQNTIVDASRRENDAEHMWHLAVIALVLREHAAGDVDIARVVEMLLVHDVVEIDAGDTGIHDLDSAGSKAEREAAAADRLFGLLPEGPGAELRAAWEEYEARTTAEARFASVFDRLAPFLLNLGAGGIAWKRWGVSADRVRHVLEPVVEGAPELGRFVEAMIERAVEDGLLRRGGGGLLLP